VEKIDMTIFKHYTVIAMIAKLPTMVVEVPITRADLSRSRVKPKFHARF
jgi:hypothetical protein